MHTSKNLKIKPEITVAIVGFIGNEHAQLSTKPDAVSFYH